MRLYDILSEAELNKLDNPSRRGFLKKAGAAALGMAGANALAKPFQHRKEKNDMDDTQTKVSAVSSDNSNAILHVIWPGSQNPGVVLEVPGKVIPAGLHGGQARIKFGGNPPEILSCGTLGSGRSSMVPMWPSEDDMDIGRVNLAKRILSYSGPLKIEIEIYNEGKKVFNFTIEQDKITKQLDQPAPQKEPEMPKKDYKPTHIDPNKPIKPDGTQQ